MSSDFNPDDVNLAFSSNSERDEGDMDYTNVSKLLYKGKEIWRVSTCWSSNIGGAWGQEHASSLSPDKKTITIQYTTVGGNIHTGRTTEKGKTEVFDVVKLIAEAEQKMKKA